MNRPPLLRLFPDELIVDSFAGGGGASTGIEMATGRSPDIAINHDAEALALHAANHPTTRHYCESVWDVDPVAATGGRPVGLAWFSPDCKHFSKAKGGKPVDKNIRGLAWVAVKWAKAAECIDWSIPCPSIFERARPLAENTLRRIARGIQRYVIEAAEPYIVRIGHTGHGDGGKVRGIGEPLSTITSKAEHLIVSPTLVQTGYGERPGQAPRVPGLDKPLGTVVASGQKHALVAAFLARHYTGMVGSQVTGPLPTITAVDHHSLVTASLEATHDRDGSSATDDFGQSDRRPRGRHGLEASQLERNAPSGTAASGDKVEARLPGGEGVGGRASTHRGGASAGVDGAVRSDSAWAGHQSHRREQEQQRSGESGDCDAQRQPPARVPDEPSQCIDSDAEGGSFSRVCGQSESAPGERDDVRGHRRDSRSIEDDGLSGGNHATDVHAFLIQYYGTSNAAHLGAALPTVTTHDRFGLVTVHGVDYQIVDIGMRMLEPRELYRAQGFPDSYVIDIEHHGRRLSKSAQVRMCGNSVSPVVAAALIGAQFVEQPMAASA